VEVARAMFPNGVKDLVQKDYQSKETHLTKIRVLITRCLATFESMAKAVGSVALRMPMCDEARFMIDVARSGQQTRGGLSRRRRLRLRMNFHRR